MASNVGDLASTVTLNIDPFQQSTRILERQMRAIDQALKANEIAFKNNSKNINAQKSNYNLTGKSIDVYNAQLEKQKEHYEKLKESIGDYNEATAQQKMDLLGAEAAVAKTTAKVETLAESHKKLGREIAIQESNWTKFGDGLDTYGKKLSNIGDGLNTFGNKMTMGVTVPIVAGVTAVAKAAIDWESAFAGTKKTVDEVVDANGKVIYSYDELEAGLRSLAKELPATHAEIAATAENAGQLGIATENVISFTKTMIDLGESTNLGAEEASVALARLANITQMPQENFERLGSTIVELGNNLATTESEITEMALRLAGAGSQVGMSESQIVSFAAALSSVGIQAEAGGSAFSKVMVEMQLATENGGDSLKNFADVAGMSSEEFSKAFKDDAAGAIISFIEGLATAEERGMSAIKVLDDMEITEVRLRDSLLRAANASGVFSDALDMGSTAWDENTALAEEAAKRYETVESQLAMLKNEVIDIGIEFGGPFLGALRDGLQAAKPFIETMGDMARKFSEMDVETQRSIMKFIGLTAAIGPASKVMGGLFKIVGGGMSVFGGLSKKIGMLTAGSKIASGAIAGVGTSATTAIGAGSVGVAGFGATIGGLVTPIGLAVGAIAGITGAVYLGKKAFEDYQRSGARWGTEVTEEQDKVLKKHKELVDVAAVNMKEYEAGVKDSAENVKESFNGIAESINESIERQKEALDKSVELLNENQQDDAQKEVDKQKDKLDKEMELVKSQVETINGIYDNASQNKRKLSAEETEYIKYLSKDLTSTQVKNLGLTEEENKRILSRMSLDMSDWSRKQFNDYKKNLRKQLDSGKESLEEQVKSLKEIYKDNPIKLDEEIQKATKSHEQATDDMVRNLAEAVLASGGQLSLMEGDWKRWGYTTEEVAALVSNNLRDTVQNVELFAQGTKEADMAWNTMVFDPKTGEVKDNLTEFLSGIAKTDEGWEQLKLITKEANLTTNARDEIAIAIGESGRWNDLSVDEKNVVVNGDQAKLALFEAINEVEGWDKVEPLIKELGVHNLEAVTKLITSQELLEKYEDLTPEEKSLLIDASQGKEITMTADKLESYKKIKDLAKHLQVTADTSGADEAQRAINNVNDKNVYIRVKYQGANTGQTAMRATGDPYFQGGQVWLGDGGRREPYLTPQGEFGVSPANWSLYDLPRGTKIWPSVQKMMDTLPRYEKGTQFDDTRLSRIGDWFTSGDDKNQSAISQVSLSAKMDELIFYLKKMSDRPIVVENTGNVLLEDGEKVGRFLAKPVNKYNKRNETQGIRLEGGRIK